MIRRGTSVRVWSLPISPAALAWPLLSVSFLLGGGAGHFAAGLEADRLADLLERYRAGAAVQTCDWAGLSGRCVGPLLLALVLSFSALGIAGLPVLLGCHGFRTGCVISGLARAWRLPGWGAAVFWAGAEDFVLLTLLLAISIPGWARAWELAVKTRSGGRLPPGYRVRCGLFCLAGLALLALYEYLLCNFITPVLWTRLF